MKKLKFMQSMFAKIFIVAILCMVIPLSVSSGVIINLASSSMEKASNESLKNIAAEKLNGLDQLIDAQKTIALSIVADTEVMGSIVEYAQSGQFDKTSQEYMAQYLGSIQAASNNLYENLFVTIGKNGAEGYADCLGNATLHNVSEENYYLQCKEKGQYIGVNVSPVTGNPVYVISYALYNPITNAFAGTVNMSIDMKTMGESTLASDQYGVTLVDLDGIVIGDNHDENSLLTSVKEVDPVGFQNMLDTQNGCILVDLSAWGAGKTYLAYAVSDNFICEVSLDVASFERNKQTLVQISILITIICFAITGLIVFFFARKLSKPLIGASEEVNNLINDINEGHGNLNTQIETKSTDETGLLVDNINSFIQTLNEVISKVRSIANTVHNTSVDTNNIITDANESSMNISAVMEELTASMQEVAASAEQMSASMDEITKTSESVLAESKKGTELVVDIKKRASEVKDSTVRSKESIENTIAAKRASLDEAIEASKKVEEINSLTTEILNIASQTNLLALNASIEAARAGESGRGFAVVAGEIGNLANNSRDTANSIQQIANDILHAVSALVEASNSMMDTIVDIVNTDYNGFVGVADNYYGDAEKIDDMIKAYMLSMADLQQTVDSVTESIKSVASTVGECTTGVSDATDNVNSLVSSMSTIKNGADENLNDIVDLADAISKFV